MACENCDGLAAQVVLLRDCLEFGRNNIDIVVRTLADTEAAATTWLEAHDREQRLVGARALVHRVPTHTDPYAPEWVSASGMRAVLEAMEREGQ